MYRTGDDMYQTYEDPRFSYGEHEASGNRMSSFFQSTPAAQQPMETAIVHEPAPVEPQWQQDMVVTGGENVFTTEVENAVISHSAVQDVAVIGVPHEEWGEAVHAIVITHPDQSVTQDELIQHCRALIAGYKLPKSVSFREEAMPLSGAGKVLKTELRKPYWEGANRNIG